MKIVLLKEAEIRQCVSVDLEAIAEIERGFASLSRGEVTQPPIFSIEVPEYKGEIDVKGAYVKGLDSFAIKVASGWLDNYRLGLATGSGMMMVFSTKTGHLQALLLDNGYLTNVRTGAAGGVAAKYLARRDIRTAGVIGAGAQARFQMMALKLVRDFKRLLVYSIVPEEIGPYISEMSPILGVEIVRAADEEQVVRESEVVVTTTPSRQPHLKAAWLHPGLHITAMGADSEGKQELEAEVLGRADRLVCDRKSQCFVRGELHHGLEEGTISKDSEILELGELTSGQKLGRQNDQQITVCDLTGTGVQDTAIALMTYRKALAKGLGTEIMV